MVDASAIRRRYYAIVGLYNLSASLIWGVNTLFLLDAGLNLFETFVANAFFTAGQVVFEIPTGVAADTVGRRFSFLASLVILAVATLAYVFLSTIGAGVVLFSIASVLLGLGFTFYSGAVEAWVVDALHSVGDDNIDNVLARGGQMFGASLIIGTIGGGLLGQIDLAWPYVVRAGLLVILFGLAFWGMHDIGFQHRPFRWRQVPREMRTIFSASLEHGWRKPPVRLVMLMTLLHMGFLIWGWYAWQPYFLELLGRPDAVWVAGLIAAALGLTMVVGGQIARMLSRLRRSTAIAAGAAVFSVGMVATGWADAFWPAIGSFLVGMLGFSIVQPIAMAALHACIPSNTRATVVSFNSLIGSAGGVASQPALGAYTQRLGDVGPGYVVGGVVTAPVVLLGLLLRRHANADRRPAPTGDAPRPPRHGR